MKQNSFLTVTYFLLLFLAENVGLFERQEGCGLFSESGWSHAVMQVTVQTHAAASRLKRLNLLYSTPRTWNIVIQLTVMMPCLCFSVLDLNAFERQNKAEGLGMVTEEGSGKLRCHYCTVTTVESLDNVL